MVSFDLGKLFKDKTNLYKVDEVGGPKLNFGLVLVG